MNFNRKIYSITNLLSDLGGAINSLFIILTVNLYPVSYFLFNLKLIKNLFIVKNEKDLFKKKENDLPY